jgi:colicin import membrane protein
MTDLADKPLVAIPVGLKPLDVFAAKDTTAIDGILARVRKEIDAFHGDISTAAGRAEIKSMAMKVVKSKTYLESIGAELAKEQKDVPKRIDATRRHIAVTLDAWRDEVRLPVTEWEAEQKRIQEYHADVLAGLKKMASPLDDNGRPHNAALLRANLDVLEGFDVELQPIEYRQEYLAVLSMVRPLLVTTLDERIKYETDQAELARLRKIQEDRDRADREEQLRKEGEERARIEAEADARAQAEKVKRDAEAAELRANLEIEAAERRAAEAEANARAKIEAEQRAAAAELAKREANIEHKRKINAAAVAALVAAGVAEEIAKDVLKLIISGAVPAVSIGY